MRVLLLLVVAALAGDLRAAGRELAPRPIDESPYYATDVRTAFAGERFLTIWRENMRDLGWVARGAFSDAAGRPLSPKSFVLNAPQAPWIAFTGTANGYLLFHWSDGEIFMTAIDLEGRATGTTPVALPRGYVWRFVADDSGFLAVGSGQTNTVIHRFDRSGRSLHAPVTVEDAEHRFDVVRAGDTFVVATAGTRGLAVHTIRDDHSVTSRLVEARVERDSSGYQLSQSNVVLAARPNGEVLLVWNAYLAFAQELRTQVIGPGGETGEIRTLRLDREARPRELIANGDGYLLTALRRDYPEELLLTAPVDARGVITGQPQVAAALPAWELDIVTAVAGTTTFVAYAENTGRRAIGSVAIDGNGAAMNGGVLSLMPRRQSSPALARDGSQFLAAWTETFDERTLVRGAIVALDGEPVAAADLASGALHSHALASNGDTTLVVHAEDNRLYASRITRDGVNLDRDAPIRLHGLWPGTPVGAVTWARDRWLVTAPYRGEEDEELRLTIILADGTIAAEKTLRLDTPMREGEWRWYGWSSLAFNGNDVLLVWAEHHNHFCSVCHYPNGPMETFAVRLAIDGTVLDEPVKLFDRDVPAASIATSGREFFVVFGTEARLLDVRNGALELRASRELFTWPVASSVTWDGSAYVAAMRYAGLHGHVAMRRFDRDANETGSIRGVRTLLADELLPPGISAILPNNVFIAIHEGDAQDGMRATLYRERDLEPLPDPPQAPQNVRVRRIAAAPANLYDVTWDAPPGAEPEMYFVEGLSYAWIPVAKTAGDTRRAVSAFPVVRVRAFNAGGASPAAVASVGTTDKPRGVGR